MVTSLIRGKQFNRGRLPGKYWRLYYHKVLEAKIALNDHVVISLGTEFIENEKEDVSEQDSEINAASHAGLCKEKGTAFYANHVEELAGKTEIMNVFEYEYQTRTIRFRWKMKQQNIYPQIKKMDTSSYQKWE